ncbi:MAG: hypothetical protein ACR2PL_22185 [Dehalococcoidia bacterium]
MMDHAAARAAANPFFVAYWLKRWQQSSGFDTLALAAWLQLPLSSLSRLALCRRPDPAGAAFTGEVAQIAEYAGCDAERLAGLLRATP